MDSEEYIRCIKKLNPQARVVIWQDTPDSEPYSKWDAAHIGPKPTREECLAVLPDVQAEIRAEKDAALMEGKIQAEIRAAAIERLITKGTLPAGYK